MQLAQLLARLEAFHGRQRARWPTDPYRFLVWWHCGYPPSEERCARGWRALEELIGIDPGRLRGASRAQLARALAAGGMVPRLRAARVQEIAARVREDFGGKLRAALRRLGAAKSGAALRQFPGIGRPGAERIMLFGGIAPVAAVPSSCPHVVVRIRCGREPVSYVTSYAAAQRLLEEELPASYPARRRAFLLLQQHGRQVCRRADPRCELCPVARYCAFFAGRSRRAAPRARRRGAGTAARPLQRSPRGR